MIEEIICGNSNMRNLTEEDRKKGRSHRCSMEDPCNGCIIRLGRIKFKELKNERRNKKI